MNWTINYIYVDRNCLYPFCGALQKLLMLENSFDKRISNKLLSLETLHFNIVLHFARKIAKNS